MLDFLNFRGYSKISVGANGCQRSHSSSCQKPFTGKNKNKLQGKMKKVKGKIQFQFFLIYIFIYLCCLGELFLRHSSQ